MTKEREAFLRSLAWCIVAARSMWGTGVLIAIYYFIVSNLATAFLGIAMISLGAYMDRAVSKIFREMCETGEDKL